MAKRSMGILLLVLVVVLLVVVSSRLAPERDYTPDDTPEVTDDPIPPPTEPPGTETPVPETPEPTPNIREILPGVSRGDWNLKLVNNLYVLPSTFAPDVTAIRDGQYFDTRAAEPLEEMLSAAEAAGYTVNVRTGYRPYSTQAYLFFGKASQIQWGTDMEMIEAEEKARKVVAYPGTSEHQLGLCVDILDDADTNMVAEEVEGLPVLRWLTEHCAEYGFILRYPENKQDVTGWYEPWHFRYVGVEAAQYITENDLCLEEFIDMF